MKNTKIRNIWSHDANTELGTEEEIKDQYKEFLEINNLPPEWLENEEKINDYAFETVQYYLDDVQTEIKCHEDTHGYKTYLIIANLGLWFGNRRGGKVVK